MKGKYLIAIAFLASWTVITASKSSFIFEAENECPAVDPCPPKLILDDKSGCTRYYECKGGQKQPRSCASGLFFSKKWNGCVRQEISDCPIDDDEETCPAVDPCPPKLIPDNLDCSRYYECKGGQKQLRSCASGLFFSKKWNGCVSPELSDCPPTTPPVPGDCKNGELLKHECICYKYYQCHSGRKVLRECQAGWHFDENTRTCQVGECNIISTSTTTQRIGECVHGELLPHECKCIKYYFCNNGRKALRECQVGWHFDKNTRTCKVGTCQDAHRLLSICQEGELFSHEYRCNKYYQCENGQEALRECENGWHFDKDSKTCVAGEECDDGNTIFGSCVNGDKMQHNCDCNKYYICNNEDWYLDRCPNGLHFSISLKNCMAPNEAGCI